LGTHQEHIAGQGLQESSRPVRGKEVAKSRPGHRSHNSEVGVARRRHQARHDILGPDDFTGGRAVAVLNQPVVERLDRPRFVVGSVRPHRREDSNPGAGRLGEGVGHEEEAIDRLVPLP